MDFRLKIPFKYPKRFFHFGSESCRMSSPIPSKIIFYILFIIKDALSVCKIMKTVIRKFYEDTDSPQELKNTFFYSTFFTTIFIQKKFSRPVRRENSCYSADMVAKFVCLHIEITKRPSACKQWK